MRNVMPKIEPILQAKQLKYNHLKLTKLEFSDILVNALCAAVIQRSLKFVLSAIFPQQINIDVIGKKSFGKFEVLSVDIVSDGQ